ncbi:hypothetical protein Droror1_Dr00022919 [Drosera rotundifolia]
MAETFAEFDISSSTSTSRGGTAQHLNSSVHYVLDEMSQRVMYSTLQIILDVPAVGGRLMLVDMAGSENIEQASQLGLEAKMQTGKINQGNIVLKRVVESIANRDSHVPFRDSKLTMLLQDSFEDDKSKILMILCASPDPKEMHKTISTLEYGAKAKGIIRGPPTPTDKFGDDSASSVILVLLRPDSHYRQRRQLESLPIKAQGEEDQRTQHPRPSTANHCPSFNHHSTRYTTTNRLNSAATEIIRHHPPISFNKPVHRHYSTTTRGIKSGQPSLIILSTITNHPFNHPGNHSPPRTCSSPPLATHCFLFNPTPPPENPSLSSFPLDWEEDLCRKREKGRRRRTTKREGEAEKGRRPGIECDNEGDWPKAGKVGAVVREGSQRRRARLGN